MSRAARISRQFSLCAVMEAIVQNGPISRASIAKQTGLSKQTISEIVRQLEDGGWVRETGKTSGHIGRTAVTYEIIPTSAFIAAVDLGGTKARVAIVDLSGQIFSEEVEPTDERGGLFVTRQIGQLCRRAAEQVGIEQSRIRFAVVGVPGAPEAATGRVFMAPNISGFDRMDVAAALEDSMGVEVTLENDVNLAVLGESWLGEGQGVEDLAYIALGTGIGSGLLVAGQLIRGFGNAAGELGFLPFGADPFEPESLRAGAYERVVASSGMKLRYRELTGAEIGVPDIFERAAAEDDAARTVLDETARYLARGIAAVCCVVNPEKIILGGSIGSRLELIERVRSVLPLCLPVPVRVEASSLGARAAIVGAAAIGLSHVHNALFGADAPDGRLSLPPANVVSFKEASR